MIIGLDVGGTHTDAVLFGRNGLIRDVKVATDPDMLYETVMKALDLLLEDQDVAEIKRMVLSTTLATNLVVQEKLPPVALLVSAGPGVDPEHFRIGEHYYRVSGALDHSGRELEAVNEQQIRALGEKCKELGLDSVGVVSKFSVRNPDHEMYIAEILQPYVPHIFMGHQASGGLNFPRRIATTYLNAVVCKGHADFYAAVQQSLEDKGISVPIRILKPDGGNMNMASSLSYPAQTILSGPSASVMGAIASAPKNKTCLVLDIGGTTTDMAVILSGAPLIAAQGIEVGPHKTLIRALLTKSIGIGGDSVVRFVDGKITIGPDRQGVAMAYGGPAVTPTDAMCVLGIMDEVDPERSFNGLEPLAEQMGVELKELAERILDSACSEILSAAQKMVDQINSRPVYTVHEMYEGLTVVPDHILVLGGPASQFSKILARRFEGEVSPVPNWQVANAIGCALARTTCEVTIYADTSQKILTTQGEKYYQNIPANFSLREAREIANELVRKKAVARGASPDFLQTEILEESQFNMIRGFHTIGKNIRVRAQVKPGLIHGYDHKTQTLQRDDL